jgi:hypothetical protein
MRLQLWFPAIGVGVACAVLSAAAQDGFRSGPKPQDFPKIAANMAETTASTLQDSEPVVDGYFRLERVDTGAPLDDGYVASKYNFRTFETLLTGGFLSGGGFFSGVRRIPNELGEVFLPELRIFNPAAFEYVPVKEEFVPEIKTLVYDLRPVRTPNPFLARAWIDARDFSVVKVSATHPRFDKVFSSLFRRKVKAHVDVWRMNIEMLRTNARTTAWVPALVYVEATPVDDASVRFVGQLRLWRYGKVSAQTDDEKNRISVENVVDPVHALGQPSPVEAERKAEADAAKQLHERFVRSGIEAATSEVQQTCTSMARDLVRTAHLDLPPIECRVLMTTAPMLVLPVATDTIYLNRSPIDLPPSQAGIAALLAHALAHLVMGDSLSARALLANKDVDVLRAMQNGYHSRNDRSANEQAADAIVVTILEKSRYREQLFETGLFLDLLTTSASQLPALLGPFMEHADSTKALRRSALMNKRFGDCSSLQTTCALQIGSRLVIDVGSDRLETLKARMAPATTREKRPLGMTPFFPRLEYAVEP